MANTDKVTSVDQLSKDERAIVTDALLLKLASHKRAVNTSDDAELRDLHSRRLAAVEALIGRFR